MSVDAMCLPLQDPSKPDHARILRDQSVVGTRVKSEVGASSSSVAGAGAAAGATSRKPGGAVQGSTTAVAVALAAKPLGPPRVVDLTVVRWME
jgi:hypothetical protein